MVFNFFSFLITIIMEMELVQQRKKGAKKRKGTNDRHEERKRK
jgi:hypothetical protein